MAPKFPLEKYEHIIMAMMNILLKFTFRTFFNFHSIYLYQMIRTFSVWLHLLTHSSSCLQSVFGCFAKDVFSITFSSLFLTADNVFGSPPSLHLLFLCILISIALFHYRFSTFIQFFMFSSPIYNLSLTNTVDIYVDDDNQSFSSSLSKHVGKMVSV